MLRYTHIFAHGKIMTAYHSSQCVNRRRIGGPVRRNADKCFDIAVNIYFHCWVHCST